MTAKIEDADRKPTPNRKRVRQANWSRSWLTVFRHPVFDGKPELFALEAGLTYQTIWRLGVKGEKPGFESLTKIRQLCERLKITSPV